MIYTVTYRYDGTKKELFYDSEAEARAFLNTKVDSPVYSDAQILVPLDSMINYKEKFEELYDFVLRGAGVRKAEIDKVMI